MLRWQTVTMATLPRSNKLKVSWSVLWGINNRLHLLLTCQFHKLLALGRGFLTGSIMMLHAALSNFNSEKRGILSHQDVDQFLKCTSLLLPRSAVCWRNKTHFYHHREGCWGLYCIQGALPFLLLKRTWRMLLRWNLEIQNYWLWLDLVLE